MCGYHRGQKGISDPLALLTLYKVTKGSVDDCGVRAESKPVWC